jgi:hypothetical protein
VTGAAATRVLRGGGIELAVPPGWEARIRPPQRPEAARVAAVGDLDEGDGGGSSGALVHAASFALPAQVADFGGGAVEQMRRHDVFIALLEYGSDEVGSALFAREGMPRALRASHFSTSTLQRLIAGQSGVQRFFTEAGRAFCLYVVLGDHRARTELLSAVNGVLASARIG